jgi:hypothetical protein
VNGSDLRAVRDSLGALWGLGRPLRKAELGRACGYTGRNAWQAVARWESTDAELNPTVARLLGVMLSGAYRPTFRAERKILQGDVKTD